VKRKPGLSTELARRIATGLSRKPELFERWLERDEEFRAMCEEYDECVSALKQWRDMAQTDRARQKEFETLARELEGEIRNFLAEQSEDPGERR
jgi:hypothetical protein